VSDAPPTASAWLPGIEALRGVAALVVVFHHCWSLTSMPRFAGYWLIEGFGLYGVTLFFLLSGYLLCQYFWQPTASRPLAAYWKRRVFRIVPALYVNLVILFLFFAPHEVLFRRSSIRQLFANLTMTQYLFPETASNLNVNGVLWTLTIELCLYATMPVLALAVARSPKLAIATMITIGSGWRALVALRGDGIVRAYFHKSVDPSFEPIARLFAAQQFWGFLGVFGLGIGLRWFQHVGSPAINWVHRRVGLSLPVLLASLIPSALFLRFIERASNYRHWIWFSLHDVVLAAMLVPALVLAGCQVRRVSVLMRGAEWLGQRSYGLYLWHFPIVLSVFGRGALVNPPTTTYWLAKVLLIVALSVIAGHVSFVCIERPAQRVGKSFSFRSLTPNISNRLPGNS
jgi:peptidoglycan/LPS O-acetylase OafA/YrhL